MVDQLSILVVDDEDYFRETLADKFKSSGFNVLDASNGEDALEIALKEHPDIILLDVIMGKMDGLTVMKKLRTDIWGNSARVILLTQMAVDDKILSEVAELKPIYYLLKDKIGIDEIVNRVKYTLAGK